MTKDTLNEDLIARIQQRTPAGQNAANLLTDILLIGREAAYRRLRGEVPFTFSEAGRVSRELDISLDETACISSPGSAVFRLNFNTYSTSFDTYLKLMYQDVDFYRRMASEPDSQFAMAGNHLPQSLYMNYVNLSNFKLFKWLHQHDLVDTSVKCFEDMAIPSQLTESYGLFVREAQNIGTTNYILDNTVFRHWVNAIRHFRAMNLISPQSIRTLREELLHVLEEMEEIAATGRFRSGREAQIYISDIDLEASYSYVATQYHHICLIAVYSLNAIRTSDPGMFDHMKRWISSLCRFSTLITRSGELQRIRFFRRQREIVNEL